MIWHDFCEYTSSFIVISLEYNFPPELNNNLTRTLDPYFRRTSKKSRILLVATVVGEKSFQQTKNDSDRHNFR